MAAACVAAACDGDVTETATTAATGGSATSTTSTGGSGAAPPITASCFDAPPAGAAMPPAFPTYSGGTCPALMPGRNTFTSAGNPRELILIEPQDRAPGEVLPIVFLWHWLGGDAQSFVDNGEIQQSADLYRFVAILPEEKGDLQFTWPMYTGVSEPRIEEELTFFDDMLACAAEQLDIQPHCISSAGVSAGALFTAAVMAPRRGEYLASFLSLSGGTGGLINAWQPSAHKMPGLVLWGGPDDSCLGLLSFDEMSRTLEQALQTDGHFFIECIHNCGHGQPPFDGAATATAPLWQFMLDHPYWLEDGQSPYQGGLPDEMPDWCGVGMNSATPRTGECTGQSGC